MVSHGSQANGTTAASRKLTKSLSEVAYRIQPLTAQSHPSPHHIDSSAYGSEHDSLCRTQSEDQPPRSPCNPEFLTRQPRPATADGGDHDAVAPLDQRHHYQQHQRSHSAQPAHQTVPQSCADHGDDDGAGSGFVVCTTSGSQTTPQPTHSRNLSQDSAQSFRTTDVSISASSVHFSDQLTISRPTSDGLMISAGDLSYDHRYETNSLPRPRCDHHRHEFHTYSLPRRPATATAEHQTASMQPQPSLGHGHAHQHHHHYHPMHAIGAATDSERSLHIGSVSSLASEPEATVPQVDVVPEVLYDRPVAHPQQQQQLFATLQRRRSSPMVVVSSRQAALPHTPPVLAGDERSPSDEYCSTCSGSSASGSEADEPKEEVAEKQDDEDSEKEIFIDFKPRISPALSPRRLHKKRQLHKQLSEGELQFQHRLETTAAALLTMGSSSEKDLKASRDADAETMKTSVDAYVYRDEPIVDEGVCEKCSPPTPQRRALRQATADELSADAAHQRREAFRKRSISLEGGSMAAATTSADDDEKDEDEDEDEDDESDDDDGEHHTERTAATPLISHSPPSPCMDELSVVSRAQSNFPSTDSLVNDPTRDHSDSIWNESQATVLHADRSPSESGHSLLVTPTAKRKNLLLQHQQRSSMDTEALEMEDMYAEQVSCRWKAICI